MYKQNLLVLMLLLPSLGFAHATFDTKTVASGSYYKGVIGIGHGCDGANTTKITIEIPEGVQGAKPMEKPGWQIEIVKEELQVPYIAYGKEITEEVRKLIWFGGELPDQYYDEFVFKAKISAPPQTLYFPVRQECSTGELYWHEIPKKGQNAHDYKTPAPALEVIENKHHLH